MRLAFLSLAAAAAAAARFERRNGPPGSDAGARGSAPRGGRSTAGFGDTKGPTFCLCFPEADQGIMGMAQVNVDPGLKNPFVMGVSLVLVGI